MSNKKIFISFFVLGLVLVINSCGIIKPKQAEELTIRLNEDQAIMYGKSVTVDFYLSYSNGKTKNVTNKDELAVSVSGGSYNNGVISISNYPTQFMDDQITIIATYATETDSFKVQKTYKYNYQDYLKLTYPGGNGVDGQTGDDGGTALLFRDGKSGDPGGIGGNGGSGDDLSVFIWAEETTGLIKIKIENLTQITTHCFTYVINDKGLQIDVRGGQGGAGGLGGNGGDGKDGKTKNEKVKSPGDGGYGGDGGIGGIGGTGGSVTVFLHKNAEQFKPYITILNFGGIGGEGGYGGEGGKGGSPLTGQEAGAPGVNGNPGSNGLSGMPGPTPVFIIDEFDID